MYKYYDVLGVDRQATDTGIKQAYHRQSRKLHPDKVGGSTAAFQELDRAYKVLSDKDKRQQYDMLGLDLNESEAEALEAQLGALGFRVSELSLVALARTAIGGLFVLLLPHYWPLRWLQGLAGVGLYGWGVLQATQGNDTHRWQVDKARTIGGHLMSLLAASWVSYTTNFGKRWRLAAWLYETRVVYLAAGCTEEKFYAVSGGTFALQAFGSFIAGRWLSTRSWRWATLLAGECLVSVAAPSLYSLIGTQAATLANKKMTKYAREVKTVVAMEVEQKTRLHTRIAELEAMLGARGGSESALEKKLISTNAKLDKYVEYAKQARGVVDRHVAHNKRLQSRITELEEAARTRK